MVHTQFADRLRGALNKGLLESGAPQKDEGVTALSFKEALNGAFSHDSYANKMFRERTMLPIMKALGTTDISALRLVTIADRTAVKRTDDTRFLNWLETKRSQQMRDYQLRIKERDALSGTVAAPFNMDDTQPNIHQSTYSARYNTNTAVGFRTKQSILAKDIARQQGQDDVANAEMEDVVSLIRRGENKILIANTEVTSEAIGDVPQLGGFTTRSTSNAQNAGGAALTETMLDDAIEDICEALGWDTQLGIMSHPDYVDDIDDFMINRYPGTDPMSHFERQNGMLMQKMLANNVPISTVYTDRKAKPLPVFFDPQMPANSLIVFAMDLPQLAEYLFEGKGGVHSIVLPEATNYDVTLLFSLISLYDPLTVSRVNITNLA